jgi:hypothetical protein
MTTAIQKLAAKVSQAIGVEVEITIRSTRDFTFTADGNCCDLIVNWLKTAPILKCVNAEYDEECDASFVFFTV